MAVAEGIRQLELEPLEENLLPVYSPGAHIDVQLPGMIRSYSLVNPPAEKISNYVIAVNRDSESRGGSRFIHDLLAAGDTLCIRGPRNHFPLEENAHASLFIAGGIGITPLWCMIQQLEARGRNWHLVYCARSPERAAFRQQLLQFGSRVRFHFDGAQGAPLAEIGEIVSKASPQTHLYCCGPLQMLLAFEEACRGRPPSMVHTEHFNAGKMRPPAGGFKVILQRSGFTVDIPPGKTIMDSLIASGFEAPYSCLEGVCGTCETRVIEGVPEHRDQVLSKKERASNRTMMICCSGSLTERLVLDL